MSIPTVLTQGFGNGTFAGAVADVVLRGFVAIVTPGIFRVLPDVAAQQTLPAVLAQAVLTPLRSHQTIDGVIPQQVIE